MNISFLELFVFALVMVFLGFVFGYLIMKHKRLDRYHTEKRRLENAWKDAELRYDISANEVMRLQNWSSNRFEIWEYDEIKKRGGEKL